METKPGSSGIHLPPGFRFHPSDVELINHYLKNKVTSSPLPASIIFDIDLYKYNPWELPKKALYGEDEWFFFTPRDRKYPNGARPNRAAASGYWKATGTDKPILNSSGTTSIGVKKALVFYKGRLPRGIKTDWFMLEYRLIDSMPWNSKRKGSSMRLDDWVLCRVRQKSSIPRSTWEDHGSGPVPAGHRHGPAGGCSYPKPKASDLQRTNVDRNIEMVKNSLYNDCPMLPYILASPYIFAFQDLPFSTETAASNIGFQRPSTQRSSTTTTHTDISSFDSLFNLAKRKLEEAGQGEICDLPSKNFKGGDVAHMNLCDMGQAEESNFSPIKWSSLMQCQELNQLAFAGGY